MYEKAVRELDRAISLLKQEFKNAQVQVRQLERSRDRVRPSLRSLTRTIKQSAHMSLASSPPRTSGKTPTRRPGRPVKVQGVSVNQSEKMVSAWQAFRQRKQSKQER